MILVGASIAALCAVVTTTLGGAWIPFSIAVALACGAASLLTMNRFAQWGQLPVCFAWRRSLVADLRPDGVGSTD